MSDSFLPPVVAVLAGDVAGYTAALTEAETRMTAFVESTTAALTEVEARFAALGGSAGGELSAGFGEAGAASDRMATQVGTSQKAIQAEIARTAEVTQVVGTSAEQAAAKWDAEFAAMQAKTDALTADMVAQERLVAASWEDVSAAETAAATKTEAASGAFGMSKNTLLGLGAAAVGVGYEAAKMAGDFNMATTRLVTSAGESAKNLDMVRQGILTTAGQVGYSADELAKAMYTIESGGQHGAAGLQTLKAAAQGAKTENADLVEVADAVTSVLQDYHLKASDAATVTSKLVAATSQGKTTFEQLASAMSAILPIASANHVSLSDILGDLASMTVHGMSAQQSAQNLSDTIRHMASPTQAQSKELAILGINAQQLSADLGTKGLSGTVQEIAHAIQSNMGADTTKVVLDLNNALKGLPPAVQDLGAKVLDGSMSMADFTKAAKEQNVISDKQVTSFAALAGSTHVIGSQQIDGAHIMQSYTGALRAAMGDATGLNVALMLTGENTNTTTNAIKVVSGATKDAAGNVKGWDEIQGEFNQKISQAKDATGALSIAMGEQLLPAITTLVGWLADGVNWLAQHKTAAELLAYTIAGALTLAILGLAVKGGKALWNLAADFLSSTTDMIFDLTGVSRAAEMSASQQELAYQNAVVALQEEEAQTATAAGEIEASYNAMAVAAEESAARIEAADVAAGGAGAAAGAEGAAGGAAATGGAAAAGGAGLAARLGIGAPAATGAAVGAGLGTMGLISAGLPFVGQHVQDLSQQLAQQAPATIKAAPPPPPGGKVVTPTSYSAMDSGAGFMKLVQEAQKAAEGVGHAMQTLHNNASNWASRTATDVGNWASRQSGSVTGWASRTATDAGNWASRQATNVTNWASRTATDAGHWATQHYNSVTSWASKTAGDAGSWASQQWGTVTGWAGRTANDVGNRWSQLSSGVSGWASRTADSAGREAGRLWSDFTGWAGRTVGDVVHWFEGLPGKIEHALGSLWDAGRNLLIGLWNGIQSMAGWLWDQAVNWAKSLWHGVESALGIKSPSTVAAQTGMHLVQGLALGIDTYAHQAESAALSMASRVASAMNGGAGSYSLGAASSVPIGAVGGGQVVNVQLTVQGHVWTTQDLVRTLQQELLRHGIRNGNSGVNYSFA